MNIKWLIFLISTPLFAIETNYKWIKETSDLSSGKCYEVDQKTEGNNYIKKVEENFCKPAHTLFVFNLLEGECFEVDKKTEGNLYYKRIKKFYCKPSKTSFLFSKFLKSDGCYEVDSQTQGELYFDKVEMKKCDDSQNLYTWEFKSLEYGSCYRVSQDDQSIKVRVSDEDCKPLKTIFTFKKEDVTKGICLEQHTENSKLYSKRVSIESCRPKSTVFVFYRKPDELKGSCYEIDEDTKGEKYINQVKTETCKNN